MTTERSTDSSKKTKKMLNKNQTTNHQPTNQTTNQTTDKATAQPKKQAKTHTRKWNNTTNLKNKKPLLDMRDLCIEFHTHNGVIKAIKNLNITIQEGETLAMVGESGCGKSITAHSIMGLLPSPPATIPKGKIFFEGQDLLTFSDSQMRTIRNAQISMIFQEPMSSLNPTIKIERQIIDAIRSHQDIPKQNAHTRALALLKQVRIPNPEKNMKSYPFQLSGGMQQRVMIAIALSNPSLKLIIADEPTTALDVTIQAQILDILYELKQSHSLSLLLITHDMGVVAQTADRVVVLYAGRKVEEGETASVFDNPSHPYTRGLLQSMPYFHHSSSKRLYAMPGTVPDLRHTERGCPFKNRCTISKDICAVEFPQGTRLNSHHTSYCHSITTLHSLDPKPPSPPPSRVKNQTQNKKPTQNKIKDHIKNQQILKKGPT